MPASHRYKCLNPNCPSMTDARKSMTFVTMNSPQPECPHCGCLKLEDWGEAINIMGGASENTQNSDRNFRNIAEKYGLTDMNNKDGQGVKRAAPSPENGPTVSVGGYQVPASVAGAGGCMNLPNVGVPMKAQVNQATPKNSPMMKQMTNVVAEHKARL